MGGGDFQSIRMTTGNAHCGAMQVVADDAHLALHDLRVEGFVGALSAADKASIVGDAFASHESCLSTPFFNRKRKLFQWSGFILLLYPFFMQMWRETV